MAEVGERVRHTDRCRLGAAEVFLAERIPIVRETRRDEADIEAFRPRLRRDGRPLAEVEAELGYLGDLRFLREDRLLVFLQE